MYVEDLLKDEPLGLRPLWCEDALLRREISGVAVTDLEDPARFVRPGEAVLSGLVWWSAPRGQARAARFVAGLARAGAAVLLAGEETHGSVPDDVVEACIRHGVPVAGVPAHVMFRAITDAVYLRQWSELSRHHALPGNARAGLDRLVAQEAGPDAILATALAHLDRTDAYVLSAAGRTVTATPGAAPIPAREAAALLRSGGGATVPVAADAVSPYRRWHLHLPDPDAAPPRMLQEIAAVLRRCQESAERRRAAGRRAADELGGLLAAPGAEPPEVAAALRACRLPADGPWQVLTADAGPRGAELAQGALAEAAAHAGTGAAAVGRLPDGTAFAVVPGAASFAEVWPLVAGCEPAVPLYGGTGAPAAGPHDLAAALAGARFARVRLRASDCVYGSAAVHGSAGGPRSRSRRVRRPGRRAR